jgi:uncharacterized protein YjeT (DUF2065 family)
MSAAELASNALDIAGIVLACIGVLVLMLFRDR